MRCDNLICGCQNELAKKKEMMKRLLKNASQKDIIIIAAKLAIFDGWAEECYGEEAQPDRVKNKQCPLYIYRANQKNG